MRLLLDGTNFPGSEADASRPKYGGDVFAKGIDPKVPIEDEDLSDSSVSSIPTSQQIPNERLFNSDNVVAPDEQNLVLPENEARNQKEKLRMIEEAKRIMRRGTDRIPSRLAARAGAPTNVVKALRDDSPQARDEVKEYAKQKTRDFAKDKIGGQLKGGIKKGFESGIKEGAGKAIKEGAKKTAGKAIGKAAIKETSKVVGKAGVRIGGAAAVEGGVAVAGAAAGVASFGLGFVLSLLLDIAISLGINDAVDALFELKEGNIKQATFLAVRGANKVGVFIWMLITVVSLLTVVGVFFAIPSLILLNIYMLLGSIPAFKGIPHLQGMVVWEKIILIMIDIVAFLILAAFIGGIVYYLCSMSGLGGTGVNGAITSTAASLYDWWNGGSGATFANEICTQVNAPALGGDLGGGGAGGNF